MIPSTFEYLAPTTLQEALTLLSTHKDEAKVLAGGHSFAATDEIAARCTGVSYRFGTHSRSRLHPGERRTYTDRAFDDAFYG